MAYFALRGRAGLLGSLRIRAVKGHTIPTQFPSLVKVRSAPSATVQAPRKVHALGALNP